MLYYIFYFIICSFIYWSHEEKKQKLITRGKNPQKTKRQCSSAIICEAFGRKLVFRFFKTVKQETRAPGGSEEEEEDGGRKASPAADARPWAPTSAGCSGLGMGLSSRSHGQDPSTPEPSQNPASKPSASWVYHRWYLQTPLGALTKATEASTSVRNATWPSLLKR